MGGVVELAGAGAVAEMSPPASEGDQAQIRLIAQQLVKAAVIEVRQDEESRMADSKSNIPTFTAVAALILSLGSIIYGAAIQSARIDENRRRVEALEQRNDRINEAIARIDSRTASIEAKLQILIPDRQTEKH